MRAGDPTWRAVSMTVDLQGCRVWLTRPTGQGRSWREAITTAGGQVIEQPLLEIVSAPTPDAARAALVVAESADVVIATSVNAVAGAWQLRPDFAPGGRLIGVGKASADELARASQRQAGAPPATGSTSEGLLAMAELTACSGQHIALLSGAGGRSVLKDTLVARGARVTRIALYQRMPATISATRLWELCVGSDVIVVSSGEALAHLLDLARGAGLDLSHHGLVAPSRRVVQQAGQALYWATPPVALESMSAVQVARAVAQVRPGRRQ